MKQHTSKYKKKRMNKTKKNKKNKPVSKGQIVKVFFELLHSIKIYHWKTDSYSGHKASDELHEHLSSQIDRFIEVLMGKNNNKIEIVDMRIKLYDLDDKIKIKNKIFEFRQFLIDLDDIFPQKKDIDLISIRDEMLESLNRFLYMLALE